MKSEFLTASGIVTERGLSLARRLRSANGFALNRNSDFGDDRPRTRFVPLSKEIELSSEERAICRLTGRPESVLLAYKIEQVERPARAVDVARTHWRGLSDAEISVCRALHREPADFLAAKRAEAQRPSR